MRKSRSPLDADALIEHIARQSPDEVTKAMNRVVGELEPHEPDPWLATAARRVLRRTEW